MTAPCAFVTPIGAALVGVVAGILVVYSSSFVERAGVDDVAGAISVHGTCGAWGGIGGVISLRRIRRGLQRNSYTCHRPFLRRWSKSATDANRRFGGFGDLGLWRDVRVDEAEQLDRSYPAFQRGRTREGLDATQMDSPAYRDHICTDNQCRCSVGKGMEISAAQGARAVSLGIG